jgi:hypothetical protein
VPRRCFTARLTVLIGAVVGSGCWGYPRLAIRNEGGAFAFGYCRRGRPPPALMDITVSDVDARGIATTPPVCRLLLKPQTSPTRVGAWTYGEALPALGAESCTALRPNHVYRISIGGGGDGTALFRTGDRGQVVSVDESC